jgi:hypothetical protein
MAPATGKDVSMSAPHPSEFRQCKVELARAGTPAAALPGTCGSRVAVA